MNKRIKTTLTENTDGTKNVKMTCKKCGKPIVKSNFFGMYCEDECGIEEDKDAYNELSGLFHF